MHQAEHVYLYPLREGGREGSLDRVQGTIKLTYLREVVGKYSICYRVTLSRSGSFV
jgi:hypothetical protein